MSERTPESERCCGMCAICDAADQADAEDDADAKRKHCINEAKVVRVLNDAHPRHVVLEMLPDSAELAAELAKSEREP